MPARKAAKKTKKELTPKQKRFVEEYLKDLNGTQAAIRAGYSRKTANEQATRLLAKVHVSGAVYAAMNRRSKRTEISADRVLQEIARLAFSNMADFVDFGPRGVTIKNLDGLSEDDKRCVAEVSETPGQHGRALRFKLHSKDASLAQLCKHLGIGKERIELEAGDRVAAIVEILKERKAKRDGG